MNFSSRIVVLLVAASMLASTVFAAEPVRIASIFTKTGSAVGLEGIRSEFLGVRMAAEELNARGGLLGRAIEIREYDTRSSALGSKMAAEEALKAGVTAVIGPLRSSHALAMAPVLQAALIPMIAVYATHPDVTKVGDCIFRICLTDDIQGSVMAAFAVRDLKASTAAVLTNTGDKYCINLSTVFMDRFKQLGGKILWQGDYLAEATDFSPLITRMKHFNPEVCFVPGYDRDSAYIIKQARGAGLSCIFLGGDGWAPSMYTYGGNAVTGSYYFDQWHRDSTDRKSREFTKSYEKKFGDMIDATPALSYDALMLLADAVRRAKSLDPAAVRNALASTRGFKGITGDITFDANRNPQGKQAVIMKFDKGTMVYVKTIRP